MQRKVSSRSLTYVLLLDYQGCKDAGRAIFANKDIQRIAETYFVPAAFNTWDRSNTKYAQAFHKWSGPLANS